MYRSLSARRRRRFVTTTPPALIAVVMVAASGGSTAGLASEVSVGAPRALAVAVVEQPPTSQDPRRVNQCSGDLTIIVSTPVIPPRVVPPPDGVGAGADPPRDAPGDGLIVTLCRPAAGVGVVRAVGEIDMLTASRWAAILGDTCHGLAHHDDDPRRCGDGARRGAGRGRLVCDLTGVTFFGASGLAALERTAALAAEAGVALRLVADSRTVLRPLQLTGLDRALCIDAHLLTAIVHALRHRR